MEVEKKQADQSLNLYTEKDIVKKSKEVICTDNFCCVEDIDTFIKRIREHIMRFLLCVLLSKSHLERKRISLEIQKTLFFQ